MKDLKNKGIGTKAIHGGVIKNKYGALATPIYQTSTFVFKNVEEGAKRFLGEEEGYIYSRLSNPTLTVAEEKVAILENGEKALATSSGMGAISATLWTLLKAGDHVLADKTLYGCTYAYISHGLTKFGVEVDFVDMSDLEEVKIKLKDKRIDIEDFIEGLEGTLCLNLHPKVKVLEIENGIKLLKNNIEVFLETSSKSLKIVESKFSSKYGNIEKGKRIEIEFKDKIVVKVWCL